MPLLCSSGRAILTALWASARLSLEASPAAVVVEDLVWPEVAARAAARVVQAEGPAASERARSAVAVQVRCAAAPAGDSSPADSAAADSVGDDSSQSAVEGDSPRDDSVELRAAGCREPVGSAAGDTTDWAGPAVAYYSTD